MSREGMRRVVNNVPLPGSGPRDEPIININPHDRMTGRTDTTLRRGSATIGETRGLPEIYPIFHVLLTGERE